VARLRQFYARAPWQNVTVRAVIGTTGANAAILGVNILTGIITARLLAPSGRGELAAMTMWPQFLGFALALGLPTSLVFHMQRSDHPRPVLLTAALIFGAVSGLIGSVIGICAVPYALRSYDADAVHAAQLFMVITPFTVVMNLLNAAFLREGSFALYNGFRLAAPCATLVILAVLAVCGWLTPPSAAAAYLFPTIPLMIVNFVVAWRRIGMAGHVDRNAAKSLMRYGLSYYGTELTGAISSQLDRILVVWLLTPAAMGLYVVALSFSRLFQQLPLSISTAVLPKISQVPVDEVIPLTIKAAWISLGLSVLTALPAILFAPWILGLFFGAPFAAAGHAFVILTVEALIGGIAVIVSQAFLGLGKPLRTSLYSFVGMISLLLLLLVLGPAYGLIGAALATVGSSVIRVTFMLFGLRTLSRNLRERRA
jgi:O-antigen/teichoic acid export membrane protein